MGDIATTTGARLDPTTIVDLMGLAIIVDLAVLAIMAIIADQSLRPTVSQACW